MMSLEKKRLLLAFCATGATTTAKQTSHKHMVVKNRLKKEFPTWRFFGRFGFLEFLTLNHICKKVQLDAF